MGNAKNRQCLYLKRNVIKVLLNYNVAVNNAVEILALSNLSA